MSVFDVQVTIKLSDLVNLQNRVNELDRANQDLAQAVIYEQDRHSAMRDSRDAMRDSRDALNDEISHLNVYNAELRSTLERTRGDLANSFAEVQSLKAQVARLNFGQGNWSVFLLDFGQNKINMIKEVKLITNLGLKETKDLVESAGAYYPATIISGISEDGARALCETLKDCSAGAAVIIKEEN